MTDAVVNREAWIADSAAATNQCVALWDASSALAGLPIFSRETRSQNFGCNSPF